MPRLAQHFQPREVGRELAAIAAGGGTAVLTGAKPGLVSGLGGVGKTQSAVDFAEGLWRDGLLDLLVWISSTSRQAIVDGYAQAAVDLALPGADGSDTERDAKRFHAWLTTTDHRWLIVLDDVSATADLQNLWPPARPTGQTVITTRLLEAAITRAGTLIQMDVFTSGEAAQCLIDWLDGHPDLADDIDGVATDLGYLPLALSQAAAFMLDEQVSCSTYRRWFADRRRRLDDLVPQSDGLPDDYAHTVAATLSLSIEAADRRTRPAGLATPLLRIASVLAPTGIPASVFASDAACEWIPSQGELSIDSEVIHSALQCLHRLNLVVHAADSVTVHGLVQRVMRDQVTDDELGNLVRVAADGLVEIWPDPERDSALGQALRTNAESIYQFGYQALLGPGIHQLLFRTNHSLGNAGNPRGAANAFEQLLADASHAPDSDRLGILRVRNDLAYWQHRAGDPARAAEATAALLADHRAVQGPDHVDTLIIQNNLAAMWGEAGNLSAAIQAFEQLLADRQRILGPDHPDTLTTRSNLAAMVGNAGRLAEAAKAIEELLEDMNRVLGPDDLRTLITRSNLARYRGEAGNPLAAMKAFEQLHIDMKRVLGPDDPYTLAAQASFAMWRGQAGDAAGAMEAFRRQLRIAQRVLGPDHPDTLATRANIAYWRGTAGNPSGAVEELEAVLSDRLRVLGPDHLDTLTNRNNLARFRADAGDVAVAADEYEELLGDQLRVLGPDHPDTLRTRNNLATSRGLAGHPITAASAAEELLADQLRLLGPDHPHTLGTRHNLAVWQGQAGDPAGAAQAFELLLADMLRALGPDHPYTKSAQEMVAFWRGHSTD